jgi:hypothetical protein
MSQLAKIQRGRIFLLETRRAARGYFHVQARSVQPVIPECLGYWDKRHGLVCLAVTIAPDFRDG